MVLCGSTFPDTDEMPAVERGTGGGVVVTAPGQVVGGAW